MTLHLSVLCGSQNKQQLLPYTTLRDKFLKPTWRVFTAQYAISPYIKQTHFVFKGLIKIWSVCGTNMNDMCMERMPVTGETVAMVTLRSSHLARSEILHFWNLKFHYHVHRSLSFVLYLHYDLCRVKKNCICRTTTSTVLVLFSNLQHVSSQ
jgi:hypothetical protein